LVREKRIQGSGGAHCEGELTCGVNGASAGVVDSVAVVEEFEVVTDAIAQVHEMAVPPARYAGSGIAGANGRQAITGRHAGRPGSGQAPARCLRARLRARARSLGDFPRELAARSQRFRKQMRCAPSEVFEVSRAEQPLGDEWR
jgi:hypothetical protein